VAEAESAASEQRGASPAAGSRWHLPQLRWPGRVPAASAGHAYLEVVESGGGSAPRPDIELLGGPLSLGRDGAVADTVFHDRSVSRLHARILPVDGGFRLFDAGSTSGTWVNYTPLAAEAGHDLQHGDLINLGRVQLRFKQRDASANNGANGARVVKVAPAPLAGAVRSNADEKAE
jgi:pSer/pThr/pTyr-binding forkhead associated (FHA) protein